MPKYDRSKADRNYLGYFADVSALQAFKAVGVDGDFAVVDDAIYIWDSDTVDWIAVSGGGGGSGDVTGPASSTDNALARFDLTTGKLLQNGIVLESDNGDLSAVNSLSLATSPVSAPTSEGSMYWNTTDKCLNINTGISGVVLNTGQESVIRVRNSTGSTIPNGSVVYINGATGNRPTVTLAQANAAATSTLIGMVTEDISNNDDGFVTTFGLVRELDTSTYTENDSIYLSASTPGGFTNVAPSSPNFVVFIGRVTRVNASNGEILVTPQPFVSGVTSVDSLRVHDSLMVIGSNGLSLGRSSAVVGKEVYYNGTNANTVTIQSGTTSASYTLTLPTAVASAGQVLTDAAGDGVLSWTTVSGFSWGATATGTSGTGVTLTVGNSASASTVAQSISVGNTQTQVVTAQSINVGTSAVGHIGTSYTITGASTAQRAITINPSTSGTGYGIEFTNFGGAGFRGISWAGAINQTNGAARYGIYQPTITTNRDAYGLYQGTVQSNGANGPGYAIYHDTIVNNSSASNDGYGIYQSVIRTGAGTGTGYGIYQSSITTGTTGAAYGWYVANIGGATNGNVAKFFSINTSQSSATLENRTNTTAEYLFSRTSTRTTGTSTDAFDNLYFRDTAVQNGAGGTFSVSGALMSLECVATQTAGTLTHSKTVLKLTQDSDSTGGHILFNSYSGSPTTDGIFWFDGTNFKYRAGGATKTITAV